MRLRNILAIGAMLAGALSGCAGPTTLVRRQVMGDLRCPEQSLQVTELDSEGRYRVVGCGTTAEYYCAYYQGPGLQCSRPPEPVVVVVGKADYARKFHRLVTRARALGYELVQSDAGNGYFLVVSRASGGIELHAAYGQATVVERTTRLGVQFTEDGRVEIRAKGYLADFKDPAGWRALRRELDQLQQAFTEEVKHLPPPPPPSAEDAGTRTNI